VKVPLSLRPVGPQQVWYWMGDITRSRAPRFPHVTRTASPIQPWLTDLPNRPTTSAFGQRVWLGGGVAPESTQSVPGTIATPLPPRTRLSHGEGIRGLVAASAAGRLGTPDEIAAAAAVLLAPEALFVTGIDLLVDGGVVAAVRSGGTAPDN